MSENYAFPDRMMLFRRDREMTMGDHFVHDPGDWRWYVREELYETQSAELTRLRAQVDGLREALRNIDALDPEEQMIGGVSADAAKGLVLRMGEIARAALTTKGDTP